MEEEASRGAQQLSTPCDETKCDRHRRASRGNTSTCQLRAYIACRPSEGALLATCPWLTTSLDWTLRLFRFISAVALLHLQQHSMPSRESGWMSQRYAYDQSSLQASPRQLTVCEIAFGSAVGGQSEKVLRGVVDGNLWGTATCGNSISGEVATWVALTCWERYSHKRVGPKRSLWLNCGYTCSVIDGKCCSDGCSWWSLLRLLSH